MRNRLKIKDLRLMIFLFISTLLINHSSLFINHAFAVESTPSADIKLKLDELKIEIASQAARLKDKVSQTLQNKAYAGKVQSVTGSSITIVDKDGPKIIKVNQDTVYDNNQGKLPYAFKYVEKDDYIAGLGDIDDLNNLVAKKVVLLTDPGEQKAILWGKVSSLNVSFTKVDTTATLNDFIITTGYKNKNDVLIAGFVYVIPQGGIIKLKKIATPSASPRPQAPERSDGGQAKPTSSVKPKTATPSASSGQASSAKNNKALGQPNHR